jgi:hypothetical protein
MAVMVAAAAQGELAAMVAMEAMEAQVVMAE